MELHEEHRGDSTRITLVGDLDAASSTSTQDTILAKLREGHKYLILDFSQVTFLASSGLRMLLVLAKETTALEGKLVLAQLNPTMQETLQMTGFLPFFTLVPTLEEGWAAIAS